MKIALNPNDNTVCGIKKKIEENDGYCPCSLQRNKDTMCMCKDFREQRTTGYCHCKLYVKFEGEIPPQYED